MWIAEKEDEYHFVIVCPAYVHLRRMYLKPVYYVRPSVYKFVQLMKSNVHLLALVFFLNRYTYFCVFYIKFYIYWQDRIFSLLEC